MTIRTSGDLTVVCGDLATFQSQLATLNSYVYAANVVGVEATLTITFRYDQEV